MNFIKLILSCHICLFCYYKQTWSCYWHKKKKKDDSSICTLTMGLPSRNKYLVTLVHKSYSHRALYRSSFVFLVCLFVKTGKVLTTRGIWSTVEEKHRVSSWNNWKWSAHIGTINKNTMFSPDIIRLYVRIIWSLLSQRQINNTWHKHSLVND